MFETPMRIASLDEYAGRATHLLDVAEHMSIRLLFESAVESIGDAAELRLRDEREAGHEPPEPHAVTAPRKFSDAARLNGQPWAGRFVCAAAAAACPRGLDANPKRTCRAI
jgi:hypothetical protein